MIVAESLLLLAGGLAVGTLTGMLALLLMAAVFQSGLAASLVATAGALRMPLLSCLRSE